MYLFGANQSIEEILSLPAGEGYTGVLAEGDYSLEDFPVQEQLKQLAKEYWTIRCDRTFDHESSNIKTSALSQTDKQEFEQRTIQSGRQLVTEIIQEDMKIETILRKLTEEQPGEAPLFVTARSRDILSLLDPRLNETNPEFPLIRRFKTERSNS